MSIDSQPGPDGRSFTHRVTAWETEDGWGIEVSLWSENESPSAEEVAALEGTLAEVLASVRI